MMLFGFFNALSPWHLLVIGVVALLFFGNRLPEVARSFGRSINEFKRGLKDIGDEIDEDEPSAPAKRNRLSPPDERAPHPKAEADDEDDEEYEYVRVPRKKRRAAADTTESEGPS